MPSPFPGMDPFLEHQDFFPDLHASLITYMREAVQQRLPAGYFAAIGQRVWVDIEQREIEPDVHIRRGQKSGNGGVAVAESVQQFGPITVRIIMAPVATPVSRLLLFGQDGDDILFVVPWTNIAAELYGGAGNAVTVVLRNGLGRSAYKPVWETADASRRRSPAFRSKASRTPPNLSPFAV